MSVAFFFSLVFLTNFGSEAFPLIYRRADVTGPSIGFIFTKRRTLLSIIWTCLSTTFVCAWVSVYPNVPPKQNYWRGLKRRLKLIEIFWVLVTPELVLAWALRQWFAAAYVRRIYNTTRQPDPDKAWTLHHGYFLVMGGFTLIEPNTTDPDRGDALSFERFLVLVEDADVHFPPITADEIQDRSKTDELSQLIAVVQVLWFLFQCLIRIHQKLPLTQLELITLTPVVCNAFTVGFWWWKPQDVQVPAKIRLPLGVTRPPAESQTLFGRLKTTLSDIFFGIIRAESVPSRASHVPTLYAPKTIRGSYGRMLVFAAFGAISGGLLYLGVKISSFATPSEFKIWHHTSLAATIIPMLLLPFDFLIEQRIRKNMPGNSLLNLIFGSLFLLHVTVKVALIAQAVVLLRTQPPNIFVVDRWSQYIPHIS